MISWGKLSILPILLYAVFFASYSAIGQEQTLKKTKDTAVVDGLVKYNEYSFTYEVEKMKFYLNWTKGKLHAALIVDTNGWVGIGFNSQKMDDADIFIGFVRDGNPSFNEQVGLGHRHKDTDLPYLKSVALKESGGKTTLELELLDNGVIKPGQKTLPIIIAFGDADSLSSYHTMRNSFSVKLGP